MMRFMAEKAAFLDVADNVLKCVNRRGTIPVLSMFKIDAGTDKITISGTDLDIAARSSFTAEVQEEGSCCVPAELFFKSIKQARGTELTFVSDDRRAQVSIGRAVFKWETLPPEDFPDSGMLDQNGDYRVSLRDDLVERVAAEISPAASTEVTRHYMCGVFMNKDASNLDFVATDGKMLSKLKVDGAPEGDRSGIIVPTRVFGIAKGCKAVVISDFFIRFERENFAVATKLIDGNFPPYQRVIDSFRNTTKHVVVDKKEFASALDRIVPYSEGGRDVAIALRVSDGEMRIEGVSSSGEAVDVIPVDGDDSFDIGMSCRVIGPLVESFRCETIRLGFSDAKNPLIITDPVDDSRIAVAWAYALRQSLAQAA